MSWEPSGVKDSEHRSRLLQLAELNELSKASADEFYADYHQEVAGYRAQITLGIQAATERLSREVAEISGDDAVCLELAERAAEYVDWLQWCLWDLPEVAVATRPTYRAFRKQVARCGLVYLSIRLLDDVIDRHSSYKGRHPTLLATVAEHRRAEGLAWLAGLLVMIEGLAGLARADDEAGRKVLRQVLDALRRTVVGMILEHGEHEEWDSAHYERLIELKKLDSWRLLYNVVDARHRSPLYPFLEIYYALAQKLSDIEDFSEDALRGQPNLISFQLARAGAPPRPDSGWPEPGNGQVKPTSPEMERLLASEFLALGQRAEALPSLERRIAQLKLGELLGSALQMGLFELEGATQATRREKGSGDSEGETHRASSGPGLGLDWSSSIDTICDRLGASALEETYCPVCASTERRTLFEKQGFPLQRCLGCTHAYFGPRLRPVVGLRLAQELDVTDHAENNPLLATQRHGAELLSRFLHQHVHGPRLLDLGCGTGNLLRLAQAHGFEVFGMDSSPVLVDRLVSEFGQRVCCATAGVDPIPWEKLDVVVLSHVLEYFHDPEPVLREIRGKLRPGGWLCAIVPDADSLHFRVFAKHWDQVNPLSRPNYFTEDSLSRLLGKLEFVDRERGELPASNAGMSLRWVQMMEDLGGNASGDLLMLARRPIEESEGS